MAERFEHHQVFTWDSDLSVYRRNGREPLDCSARRNLSFNWRLILAPEFVLRYLVTHEEVHLSIPDHSMKFWLTVQSLCRETERAKQWLSANGRHLLEPLSGIQDSGYRNTG